MVTKTRTGARAYPHYHQVNMDDINKDGIKEITKIMMLLYPKETGVALLDSEYRSEFYEEGNIITIFSDIEFELSRDESLKIRYWSVKPPSDYIGGYIKQNVPIRKGVINLYSVFNKIEKLKAYIAEMDKKNKEAEQKERLKKKNFKKLKKSLNYDNIINLEDDKYEVSFCGDEKEITSLVKAYRKICKKEAL